MPDWEPIMRVAAKRGMMSADSVAAVIAFLASDDAASIHGSIQMVHLRLPRRFDPSSERRVGHLLTALIGA